MAPQELGQFDGHRVGGARHYGLGLALLVLVLMLMLVLVFAVLSALLLLLLGHRGLLLARPLLEVLDELGDRHAGLRRVLRQLPLHGLDLLRRGHLALGRAAARPWLRLLHRRSWRRSIEKTT